MADRVTLSGVPLDDPRGKALEHLLLAMGEAVKIMGNDDFEEWLALYLTAGAHVFAQYEMDAVDLERTAQHAKKALISLTTKINRDLAEGRAFIGPAGRA
jgi:3-phenylpropionate/cinnamic acid dioxygenase small subunit